MDKTLTIKDGILKALLVLIAVILATYFRVMLLVIYPILVLVLLSLFKFRIHFLAVLVFGLIMFSWLLSFRHGFYIRYNLVSFYYVLPFILLVFALPKPGFNTNFVLTHFMNALALIVIINDLIGFVQYFQHPTDDSFVGIYGRFTVTQNGLSILNGLMFFYYLLQFQSKRNLLNGSLAVLFLTSCIMGFYGAGLMALLGSIILVYVRLSFKSLLRLTAYGLTIGLFAYLVFKVVSPYTLEYNIAIVKRFVNSSIENAPRKLIIFFNYGQAYFSNLLDFLFGSGPGTFNSRSAFMVGSPTYFNFDAIKSTLQPKMFSQYAYPLWNESNTGPYDGFMNQPFSSGLSLLGEYGFLVTTLVIGFALSQLSVRRGESRVLGLAGDNPTAPKLFKFTTFYFLILILIDNYIEYPEIILVLLFANKLSITGRHKLNIS